MNGTYGVKLWKTIESVLDCLERIFQLTHFSRLSVNLFVHMRVWYHASMEKNYKKWFQEIKIKVKLVS